MTSLSFRDFGPADDGSADVSAKWAQLMAEAEAQKISRIHIPRGQYRFDSRPEPFHRFPVILEGDGAVYAGTKIIRNYSAADGEGLFSFIPGADGSVVRNLCITADASTSGGAAITWTSTPEAAFTMMNLENLYLTAGGQNNWTNIIRADGSAKTAGAIGARLASLKNVHCFGASGISAYFKSVEGLSWLGGGLYAAGGTGFGTGAIAILGTDGVYSNNATVIIETCYGFILSKLNQAILHVASMGALPNGYSIEDDALVTSVNGKSGRRAGALRGNWQSSTWT